MPRHTCTCAEQDTTAKPRYCIDHGIDGLGRILYLATPRNRKGSSKGRGKLPEPRMETTSTLVVCHRSFQGDSALEDRVLGATSSLMTDMRRRIAAGSDYYICNMSGHNVKIQTACSQVKCCNTIEENPNKNDRNNYQPIRNRIIVICKYQYTLSNRLQTPILV